MSDHKLSLYLGLTLPEKFKERYVHYPLIEIHPIELPEIDVSHFSHFLFTSKSAVHIFCAKYTIPKDKIVVGVGKSTAAYLEKFGVQVTHTASDETSEGVVKLLETLPLENANFLWPHSAKSRNILPMFFEKTKITHFSFPCYDTLTKVPERKIPLEQVQRVFFTSPSTVDAFIALYGRVPYTLQFETIGPVTSRYLESLLRS